MYLVIYASDQVEQVEHLRSMEHLNGRHRSQTLCKSMEGILLLHSHKRNFDMLEALLMTDTLSDIIIVTRKSPMTKISTDIKGAVAKHKLEAPRSVKICLFI